MFAVNQNIFWIFPLALFILVIAIMPLRMIRFKNKFQADPAHYGNQNIELPKGRKLRQIIVSAIFYSALALYIGLRTADNNGQVKTSYFIEQSVIYFCIYIGTRFVLKFFIGKSHKL